MSNFEIHIPGKRVSYTDTSKVIRIKADAYNKLADICNESPLSMMEIASRVVSEAAEHVVLDRE